MTPPSGEQELATPMGVTESEPRRPNKIGGCVTPAVEDTEEGGGSQTALAIYCGGVGLDGDIPRRHFVLEGPIIGGDVGETMKWLDDNRTDDDDAWCDVGANCWPIEYTIVDEAQAIKWSWFRVSAPSFQLTQSVWLHVVDRIQEQDGVIEEDVEIMPTPSVSLIDENGLATPLDYCTGEAFPPHQAALLMGEPANFVTLMDGVQINQQSWQLGAIRCQLAICAPETPEV